MSSSQNTGGSSSATGAEPDSSFVPGLQSLFGPGLVYNPLDPTNSFPHHETGEEVYGPPPLFGMNKHDPFNMKPFNPNALAGLFAQPPMVSTLPQTMGPNPFTPLLQPMAPSLPMAPGVPTVQTGLPAPPMAMPAAPQVNPLLMAAAFQAITKDSSFTPGQDPSSSSVPGGDPSSSWYTSPYYPYYQDPFSTYVVPQYQHPTDPNNQYPHPQTGSLTQPGPALAGGYNAYDPQNLIGAPPVFSETERALEHNRAAAQPQSPYAPYKMHQVPIP